MKFEWEKLPKLNIPYYEVLVEKGDLLFVPSGGGINQFLLKEVSILQ